VDLTTSYRAALPAEVLERYELRETRNASAILAATSGKEFTEVIQVLTEFELTTHDLVSAGGNESRLAHRLNDAFRALGWREARVDTRIESVLRIMPYRPVGEIDARELKSEVSNQGYKVDNIKGRIAVDVEWNAKDGNLDRDVGAYRAFYEMGTIDGAVLITRTHDDLRELAQRLALAAGFDEQEARKRLNTTTTTNIGKLLPRMTRGDGGGCPILAVAISARCWRGS